MGLDLSKITKLISDLCSEITCKSSCCHDALLFEFDKRIHQPTLFIQALQMIA